jgi:HK97 family phage prohead protease
MLPVNFECPVEITKAYEDEEGLWVVEGYAATTDFDLQDDIISEEAIKASARDLIENSTVLHNHNTDDAIGRVLASRARKDGLFLKIMVSKTAPEIWQQIREGVLNKFSVRGKVLEARKQWISDEKRYARVIMKMRLLEVSLVAVPANPKARAIRWYVEKALDEFEKAGGEVPPAKGGTEMGDEKVIEEELLEAGGEPERPRKPEEKLAEAKGFPAPDALDRLWAEHTEKAGLKGKGADEVFEAWVAFCQERPGLTGKQNGYPHPYPYPYPKPAAANGAKLRRIVEIVDGLLQAEKDEARKKLLQEVRAIAAGAANAYPSPANARKEEAAPGKTTGSPAASVDEVEKAGRKLAGARLVRLKKLLDELKGLIAEVDDAQRNGEGARAHEDGAGDTLARIAKALGIEGEKGEVPNLAQAVVDLRKRLDDLEGAPAVRTSLDEGDEPAGKKDGKAVWKGLL